MLDRILVHWPLKLLALEVAVALWAAIMGEDDLSKDYSVPLQARIDERHAFLRAPPTNVDVRLVGPESSMRKVDQLRLGVHLDLEDTSPGPHDIRLSEIDIRNVPPGVRVAFFDPPRVSLETDRKRRVDLPIAANILDEPLEGYYHYKTVVRPETIRVEGPESAIEALTEILTDPVSLERWTRTFDQTVEAVPDVPGVTLVKPGSSANIHVVIAALPETTRLEDVPIIVSSPGYDAASDRNSVRLTVSGPPALLQYLTTEHIRALADIGDDLGPGRHRVDVRAEIVDMQQDDLDCLTIDSIDPARIDVRLTEPISEPS